VAQAFGAVAEAAGPGARKLRDARLGALAARASAEERDLLQRVIYGEMRMGLSEGLVLEAIAEAAGVAPAAVRRAALVTGDLTAVAALALGEGAEALAAAAPRRPSNTSTTARVSSSTVTATAWRSGAAACPTSPGACPTS
jgi:DNA ligase-1